MYCFILLNFLLMMLYNLHLVSPFVMKSSTVDFTEKNLFKGFPFQSCWTSYYDKILFFFGFLELFPKYLPIYTKEES